MARGRPPVQAMGAVSRRRRTSQPRRRSERERPAAACDFQWSRPTRVAPLFSSATLPTGGCTGAWADSDSHASLTRGHDTTAIIPRVSRALVNRVRPIVTFGSGLASSPRWNEWTIANYLANRFASGSRCRRGTRNFPVYCQIQSCGSGSNARWDLVATPLAERDAAVRLDFIRRCCRRQEAS